MVDRISNLRDGKKPKSMAVVVGLIMTAAQGILVAQRPLHKMMGGMWEFPGGKVEADEDHFEALKRELQEELGIVVNQAERLTVIHHDYPERSVSLDVWQVTSYVGVPQGLEGQQIQWVSLLELKELAMLAASEEIKKIIFQLE